MLAASALILPQSRAMASPAIEVVEIKVRRDIFRSVMVLLRLINLGIKERILFFSFESFQRWFHWQV